MHFETDRHDLHRTRVVDDDPPAELGDGEVLLRLDRFAFTANNITYAVVGEMVGYWYFFPTEEPWIRVPVMGHADVVASRAQGVEEGTRVFGFFPMGDHHVVEAAKTDEGFVDRAPHRDGHPMVYRSFSTVDSDLDDDAADRSLLLRGLFLTSYLLDDFLADEGFFDADQVVVLSASSKTAIALTQCLASRDDIDVVGVTSAGNVDFVERVGFCDQIVTYDDLTSIDAGRPTIAVDMAGAHDTLAAVHQHLGDSLRFSSRVGMTHWEDMAGQDAIPGPEPQFFFAPSQIAKRNAEWGPEEFQRRSGAALDAFADDSRRWMDLERSEGAAGMEDVFRRTLDGEVPPDRGQIVLPAG